VKRLAEEISRLLGVKTEIIENLIKVLGILVAIIIFLLFFALLPMYAVILFGVLTLIVSLYFENDKGIYAGLILFAVGILGIFVPQIAEVLSVISRNLNELLIYP